MYILSQDKSSIINVDNVSKIYIYKESIHVEYSEERCTIATYSTKEKVSKVMELLMERIQNGGRIEKILYATPQFATYDDYKVSPCCFEMPQDNEIK